MKIRNESGTRAVQEQAYIPASADIEATGRIATHNYLIHMGYHT